MYGCYMYGYFPVVVDRDNLHKPICHRLELVALSWFLSYILTKFMCIFIFKSVKAHVYTRVSWVAIF